MIRNILVFSTLFASMAAWAAPQSVRWTGAEDRDANLDHILSVVKTKTGVVLSSSDFIVWEDCDLATTHFRMYQQVAGKTPRKGLSVRVWTKGTEAVQVEGKIDAPVNRATLTRIARMNASLSSQRTMEIVRKAVAAHPDDATVRTATWQDYFEGDRLVRVVKAVGRRGTHAITLSIEDGSVVSSDYREFPQDDGGAAEFSIPVEIFPVYEEVPKDNGPQLPRIKSELRYVQTQVKAAGAKFYEVLGIQQYLDTKYDAFLGMTEEGRAQGYWAMPYLKTLAGNLYNALPSRENSYANGVNLLGRYATVSIHPDAPAAFKGINFTPGSSPIFKPLWKEVVGNPGHEELLPRSSLLGRPIRSAAEALARPATRDPKHDSATYLNDGYDELQVYWAVTQMFESLRAMGWTDPELSTRPFNAFLFDPDITYRDNAFYHDDTINFTTYSSAAPNMARDNTTIWHELGHGVMDRLMGDHIELADTGGLSEGMADFVAQLVLNDVTNMGTFPGKELMRIMNHTGFNLTNEVHDDGEAYGGAMNDILIAAMKKYGRPGLTKVTDLTMEAMRLSRNNPGLTANDWFNHMLFADELGATPIREPKELRNLIVDALASRNFSLAGEAVAKYTLRNGDKEVTATGPGSRNNPIVLKLKESETKSYNLSAQLTSTAAYQFKYPVKVRVQFRGGPLQGAVHWVQEEQGPFVDYVLNSEAELAKFELTATGKCDEINRPDNSCNDFAYVQIWNATDTDKPSAKKRFYLRIYPQK